MDHIRLSDLNRNNSVDGEVYVDATDDTFTGVYINKGFDVDSLPHHVNNNNSSNNTSNEPSSPATITSIPQQHHQHVNPYARRISVVNFNLSEDKINNNNLDFIKNANINNNKITSVAKKRTIIKKYSFYNRGASLVWNDLSFEVPCKKWSMKGGFPMRTTEIKQILKPQNGEIFGGTLTALMGPSGAGKSTLLNCLIGRYMTGVKGEISITTPGRGNKPRVNISFVPQRDDLFGTFTVKETLVFASQMKNLDRGVNHLEEAMRVMKDLNLESCSGTKVSSCSGGQVKRVCIAVELISNPDILVLDEPTTGLDSSTAAQCVTLLKKLTEQKESPPAIVATIHQPNYKIFNDFHAVYLLSRHGQNIYFGSPLKIVDYFERFNLICPSYCNPADFAIEVAYGDFGHAVFNEMEEVNRATRYTGEGRGTKFDLKKVVSKLRNVKLPIIMHTRKLVWRHWTHMFRDSNQFLFKNLHSIFIALIISYIWVYRVGEDDGCWEAFNSPVNQTELKDNLFKINVTAAKDEYITKISRMADNSAFIFAVTIYVMMISLIGCVLSFPLETNIVLKEIGNNWYKTSAYYFSKIIAQLPPMLLANILVIVIVYPMTGQIPVLWRFLMFYLIMCLVSEICESLGMFLGILMANDLVSAALVTVASSIPVILFAGFLVRYSGMPWYFRPLSYISYMRYAFESLLIIIYGFGRCKPSNSENFIEKLLSTQDPLKIASNLYESLNVSYSDVKRFSYLLDVEEDCLGSVLNHTVDYLGLYQKDEPSDGTTLSPGDFESDSMLPAKPDEPSYILSYYELSDSILFQDIAILFIFIIFFKICIYLLLRIKTRATV